MSTVIQFENDNYYLLALPILIQNLVKISPSKNRLLDLSKNKLKITASLEK